MRNVVAIALAGSLLFSCATAKAQPERQRVIGCVTDQTYTVQSALRQGLSFAVQQGSESFRFNFEADAIRYVPDAAPLPMATTEDLDQYEALIESLERAAMAGKPVLVDYVTRSREVVGSRIMWWDSCPES